MERHADVFDATFRRCVQACTGSTHRAPLVQLSPHGLVQILPKILPVHVCLQRDVRRAKLIQCLTLSPPGRPPCVGWGARRKGQTCWGSLEPPWLQTHLPKWATAASWLPVSRFKKVYASIAGRSVTRACLPGIHGLISRQR